MQLLQAASKQIFASSFTWFALVAIWLSAFALSMPGSPLHFENEWLEWSRYELFYLLPLTIAIVFHFGLRGRLRTVYTCVSFAIALLFLYPGMLFSLSVITRGSPPHPFTKTRTLLIGNHVIEVVFGSWEGAWSRCHTEIIEVYQLMPGLRLERCLLTLSSNQRPETQIWAVNDKTFEYLVEPMEGRWVQCFDKAPRQQGGTGQHVWQPYAIQGPRVASYTFN